MAKNREAVERLQLTIAEIGIELSWEGSRMADEPVRKFYTPFASHRDPDVRLQVHCGELPRLRPEAMIFDAFQNHWRLSRVDGQYLFEIFDTMEPHPRVQLALMATDFKRGQLYRRPEGNNGSGHHWSLARLMRPFGELLLSNYLSQDRGCLVHGLAVSDGGEGLLFVGHSGAGKTTLANLYRPFRDVKVLGDERVVVTQREGKYWLSGTPWPGTGFMVSAETVPLRRVFFLEHGRRNVLKTDHLVNLSGLFFQQLFLPFWNGRALEFTLEFLERLMSTVPTHRLSFVNDPGVIEFLRRQE